MDSNKPSLISHVGTINDVETSLLRHLGVEKPGSCSQQDQDVRVVLYVSVVLSSSWIMHDLNGLKTGAEGDIFLRELACRKTRLPMNELPVCLIS